MSITKVRPTKSSKIDSKKDEVSFYELSMDYLLANKKVNKDAPVAAVTNTHYIFWIDVSGSMYSMIPKIREHLKNKLPTLTKYGDKISIGWFSGKGQYGFLQREFEITNLPEYNILNNAIDKLKDVGLTSFKEPIEAIVNESSSSLPNSVFFLTDGCDNCNSRDTLLELACKVPDRISSTTIVEYGNWCDKDFLTKLTQAVNGNLIFAKDFERFQDCVSLFISKKITGNSISVEVNDPINDIVFSLSKDNQITYYKVHKNEVIVDSSVEEIFWFQSHTPKNFYRAIFNIPVFLSALKVAITFKLNDLCNTLLVSIGDRFLYQKYSNSFSGQDFEKLKAYIDDCISLPVVYLYTKNKNNEREILDKTFIKNDAFCVLDVIDILKSSSLNRILTLHKEFNYSPISARKVQARTIISEEDNKKLVDLTWALASEKDPKKARKIAKEIVDIKVDHQHLAFKPTELVNNGYACDKLVYNIDRANISFQIKQEGTVKLASKFHELIFPKDHQGRRFYARGFNIDTDGNVIVKTFRFRNYTLIQDGVVNIEHLPVRLDQASYTEFVKNGLIDASIPFSSKKVYVLDLSNLTVSNASRSPKISANKLAKDCFELEKLKAWAKVINSKEYPVPKKPVIIYGTEIKLFDELDDEQIKVLENLGFSHNFGFKPKLITDHSSEVIISKELAFGIAGLSTLPKVSDIYTKKSFGAELMREMTDLLQVLDCQKYNEASENKSDGYYAHGNTLIEIRRSIEDRIDVLENSISQQKFAYIVGKNGFSDVDASTKTIQLPVKSNDLSLFNGLGLAFTKLKTFLNDSAKQNNSKMIIVNLEVVDKENKI